MLGDKEPQYCGKELESLAFARNYYAWILAEMKPFLGRNVAEVGAGLGNFSAMLLETGISSLAVFEPSQRMLPTLTRAVEHDERARIVGDYFGRSSTQDVYDSILYVNVLEHIQDDHRELCNAHDLLANHGHLLVFVPALPCLYSNLDAQVGHFRRYMRRDLIELTEKTGFEIVKARYFDVAGIIPWYINFVLLKRSMGDGSVKLYDQLVVPVMRIVEKLIPLPIGKNILLVAKKLP